MNRYTLTVLSAICVLLSSCVNQQTGIFGRLPELYEETASRQRSLEKLLSAVETEDEEAQKAVHEFVIATEALTKEIESESKRLKGASIPVSASAGCGLQPGPGIIYSITPGIITTVEIHIPVSGKMENESRAFLCFQDEAGDVVAKTQGWYDAGLKVVRVIIPFELKPNGVPAAEGAFLHYDRTVNFKLVSQQEYQADNYEGETPEGILLTVKDTVSKPEEKPVDTIVEAAPTDTIIAEAEPEEEKWDGPLLTSKGVGAVHLGASLKGLPAAVPGVYDHKRLEKEIDEMEEEPLLTGTFLLDGKVVMTALGDEQGNIVFITVESPAIKVNVAGTYIGVGDLLQPLYKLKGFKRDDTGAFAATYNGISFAPTPAGKIHSISIGAVW